MATSIMKSITSPPKSSLFNYLVPLTVLHKCTTSWHPELDSRVCVYFAHG